MTKYAVSIVATKDPGLIAPVVMHRTAEKLRYELIRKACCQIEVSDDWEYEEPYEFEGKTLGDWWRRVATGEECETAIYWREKAEYYLARLRDITDVRADPAEA